MVLGRVRGERIQNSGNGSDAGADATEDAEVRTGLGLAHSREKDGADDGYRGDVKEDDLAGDDETDETRGFLAAASRQIASGAASATSTSPSPYNPLDNHHRPGDDAPPRWFSRKTLRVIVFSFVTCLAVVIASKLLVDNTGLVLPLAHKDGSCDPIATVTVPQHFQTTPQVFAGPTATGHPAFLAQTVTINPSATYIANQPLQTNILVDGVPAGGDSIFRHMG